jgi:hypothetical protein
MERFDYCTFAQRMCEDAQAVIEAEFHEAM